MKTLRHAHRALIVVVCALAIDSQWVLADSGADNRPETVRVVQGASSGQHLWIVLPSERRPQGWRLLHHSVNMPGPHYSPRPVQLSREPEAMAASGSRVWLVFPPREGDRHQQRGVHTSAVERDPSLDSYMPIPRDRLQLLPALPGQGILQGMVATQRGLVALILPSDDEAHTRDGRVTDGDLEDLDEADWIADAAAGVRPLLLELRGKEWIELDLPPDVAVTRASRLAVQGEDQSRLVLLSVDSENPSRMMLNQLDHEFIDENDQDMATGGNRWVQHRIELDLRRVLAVDTVRGRLMLLVQGEPRAAVQLKYLRQGAVLDLGELPEPAGRWGVFGMDGAIRMIEYSTRDGAFMRRIDPLSGGASEPEPIAVQPLHIGRVWYTSLLLVAAVLAVLMVVLIRPGRQKKVTLPEGVGVMPPIPRLLALLIDLFPGGVLSVLILRASPLELFRLPIFTDSIELAMPFIVMVGIGLAHMALSEMAKATTLGKALLGARLISTSGDKPTIKQVVVRNLVKLLILLIPVLAIFALLNPNLRGFNDLTAQTVVVGDLHEDAPQDVEKGG